MLEGLSDRRPAVREAAVGLLCKWMGNDCGGDVLVLLRELGSSVFEGEGHACTLQGERHVSLAIGF